MVSFKEYLEKYKNGTATPEEKKLVEEELEKFEALNDLAYDNLTEEISDLGGSGPDDSEDTAVTAGTERVTSESQKFTRAINREIRKTFIRIGLCSGAGVLVILLFLIFGLSPVMNLMYYNPDEALWTVSKDDNSYVPNRLSVDMDVYTELLIPLNKYTSSMTISQGFGRYYFTANKTAWHPEYEENTTIAGEISRSNLQIFTPDVLEKPSDNVMGLTDKSNQDSVMYGTRPEDAKEEIRQLKDSKKPVKAYVTLSKDLTYPQVHKLCMKYDLFSIWCGIRLPGNKMGYGFTTDTSGACYEKDCPLNKKYPELLYSDTSDVSSDDPKKLAGFYKKHFTSMLQYMADNPEFAEMMDNSSFFEKKDIDEMVSYINKKGMKIYGFAVYADKDTLLKLYDESDVYGILINAD